MNNVFNINTDDIVQLTLKLEKLHRSAMPVAVRQSLNRAAFNMKKTEIGKSFDRNFIVRRSAFIRAHSGYNPSSNTFDINKIVSEAGII